MRGAAREGGSYRDCFEIFLLGAWAGDTDFFVAIIGGDSRLTRLCMSMPIVQLVVSVF